MNARDTLHPAGGPTVLASEIDDAMDDIECAIETVNSLLRLALDQLAGVTDNHADAAIRGAERFISDISSIAERLHSLSKSDNGIARELPGGAK